MATAANTRLNDAPEVLFNKIVEALKGIPETEAGLKDRNFKAAQAALDQGNRQSLVKTLGYLREYGRYLKAVESVNVAWQAAKDAWLDWVLAENAKGHKGQLALSRAFFCHFASIEAEIGKLWDNGPDAIEPLLANIQAAGEEVKAYVQGNWCADCGTPIEDLITPKNGGKAFKPTLCRSCKALKPTAFGEVKPQKHVVKKKGSAAKRHKGAAKVKGGLSKKDQAKNAELMAEATGIKPDTRKTKKPSKAQTKTKKKGLGS